MGHSGPSPITSNLSFPPRGGKAGRKGEGREEGRREENEGILPCLLSKKGEGKEKGKRTNERWKSSDRLHVGIPIQREGGKERGEKRRKGKRGMVLSGGGKRRGGEKEEKIKRRGEGEITIRLHHRRK